MQTKFESVPINVLTTSKKTTSKSSSKPFLPTCCNIQKTNKNPNVFPLAMPVNVARHHNIDERERNHTTKGRKKPVMCLYMHITCKMSRSPVFFIWISKVQSLCTYWFPLPTACTAKTFNGGDANLRFLLWKFMDSSRATCREMSIPPRRDLL